MKSETLGSLKGQIACNHHSASQHSIQQLSGDKLSATTQPTPQTLAQFLVLHEHRSNQKNTKSRQNGYSGHLRKMHSDRVINRFILCLANGRRNRPAGWSLSCASIFGHLVHNQTQHHGVGKRRATALWFHFVSGGLCCWAYSDMQGCW